jgi:hypothetical protein
MSCLCQICRKIKLLIKATLIVVQSYTKKMESQSKKYKIPSYQHIIQIKMLSLQMQYEWLMKLKKGVKYEKSTSIKYVLFHLFIILLWTNDVVIMWFE